MTNFDVILSQLIEESTHPKFDIICEYSSVKGKACEKCPLGIRGMCDENRPTEDEVEQWLNDAVQKEKTMENKINEIFDTCKQVTEIMTKLEEKPFLTIMCMLFDEYHNTHPDFYAPEKAQVVADLVKEVNLQIGEYVNKAGE